MQKVQMLTGLMDDVLDILQMVKSRANHLLWDTAVSLWL